METLSFIEMRNQSKIDDGPVGEYLKRRLPDAVRVERGTLAQDIEGIDWIATHGDGRELYVDAKIRPWDYHDLALEIYGDFENLWIGWALDETKRCHYIIYYWQNTKRFDVLPFRDLVEAFMEHAEEWCSKYPVRKNKVTKSGSATFYGLWVAVPSAVVWAAIREVQNRRLGTAGMVRSGGMRLV